MLCLAGINYMYATVILLCPRRERTCTAIQLFPLDLEEWLVSPSPTKTTIIAMQHA
jgi:hypothetical protein